MDIPAIILAVITIIASLGAITGYFGKSRGDTVINLLKEEIDHYIRKSTEDDKTISALQAVVKSKNEQIATLTKLAQGSPQLGKLTQQIKKLVNLIQEGKYGR